MSTPHFDLDMEQGSYWTNTFNWYGGGKQMAPIEDIIIGYPTKIKVTAHGLPSVSETPVIISGVDGIPDLNSKKLGIELAKYIDVDNFEMPISSVADIWIPGTGEITWHAPAVITDYTGRMHIRRNWHSTNFIHEATTENGGMILDAADASIQIIIQETDTIDFTFVRAVYDIELIPPNGDVIRIIKGTIFLEREITR